MWSLGTSHSWVPAKVEERPCSCTAGVWGGQEKCLIAAKKQPILPPLFAEGCGMHLPGRKRLEVFQDVAPAVPSLARTLKMHCPGWGDMCIRFPSEPLKFHHSQVFLVSTPTAACVELARRLLCAQCFGATRLGEACRWVFRLGSRHITGRSLPSAASSRQGLWDGRKSVGFTLVMATCVIYSEFSGITSSSRCSVEVTFQCQLNTSKLSSCFLTEKDTLIWVNGSKNRCGFHLYRCKPRKV